MINNLDLEFINEIDIRSVKKVIIQVSSHTKKYKIIFNEVINFTYSIIDFNDLDPNEIDIIELNYQYGCLQSELIKRYYHLVEEKNPYHYFFIHGDIDLEIICNQLIVEELK